MLKQCGYHPEAAYAGFDVGFGLVPVSNSDALACRTRAPPASAHRLDAAAQRLAPDAPEST